MITGKDTFALEKPIKKFINSIVSSTEGKSSVSPSINLPSSPKSSYDLLPFILLGLIAVSYTFLHTNFNIYYEDDSWTLSNAWNYMSLGVDNDLTFLDQEGVFTGQLFGKLYFIFCGTFLNVFGWTKSNAFIFNSGLVMVSSLGWYYILKELPFSKQTTKTLPFFIVLMPPVFFAAHTGRTDAFTFLLMTLGIYMFIRKKYIAAGMIAILAMESHIMGLITLFYYLAHFLSENLESKHFSSREEIKTWFKSNTLMFLKSVLGISLGGMVYLSLHWETFDITHLTEMIASKADMVSPVNNYILAYFSDFDWIHHIPEFFLLLGTLFVYFRHKVYRDNKFLFVLMIVLFISTLITRRENRNYFVYLTPALLMFYFYTYERLGKSKTFVTSLTAICALYFGSVYYTNHNYSFDQFVNFVRSNTVKTELPVVGMPDVWFASYDKEYYPIHNERNFNKIDLEEFYLVETDYLARRSRVYLDVKENIHRNYDCNKIAEWDTYNNNKAAICHCKNDGKPNVDIIYKPYPGWQNVIKQFMPSASLK